MHHSVKQDKEAHNPQSAMTQAKKYTLKPVDGAGDTQSVRELVCGCHNTAQDQHSKASCSCRACSLDRIASKCSCRGEESLRRPIGITSFWSIAEVISRAGNLPHGGALQKAPVATPCTPRVAVTSNAQTNLVRAIRRASIPAQIVTEHAESMLFRQVSQTCTLTPAQM